MTIQDFRANFDLTQRWANEMQNNEMLQIVLSVMDEAHPARFAIHGDKEDDVSPTRAAIELGMTRGYSKYGDTLRLLTKSIPAPVDIGEPTYQKEEPA